ncbi:MAG TPA: hypothetical protein ENI37_07490 [Chloroflexi bacterium]|nr:hypothetical protein [Chloroflexota bacterium]
MRTKAVLLMLVGGGGDNPVERAVQRARQAAARDLLETLLEAGVVGRAVVATNDTAWTAGLEGLPIEVDTDSPGEPFHFGRRLAGLIRRYGVERVLYAGGGSAPLMDLGRWREALEGFGEGGPMAVTNNLHSSDWIAFFPACDLVPVVAAQERDNGLGWALAHEAGVLTRSLPPCAASRFDLDTPADLLVARAHPRLGPHLRDVLNRLEWSDEPIEGVLRVLARKGGRLAVVGRSSAAAWSALERATQCWVRLFVEERGMVASGRLERGNARSLLADFLEQVGVEGFFAELAALADAALLDSRVILAARGLWPIAADRFNADLFRWGDVQEPFLRRFSRAAGQAGMPILMGGQSVVSGGLMALLEVLEARRRG